MKALSLSALGASMGGMLLSGRSHAQDAPAPDDFVDPASLRPRPEVRVAASFMELPRPYWLGWPGTTYDLDAHEKEYADLLTQSGQKLGVQTSLSTPAISTEEGLAAYIAKMKAEQPHALLFMLQEIRCWPWANKAATETGIPTIVFAPVGTAFTGHVISGANTPGVYAISSLEWAAVDEALKMVRAKRMFEETRVLWIKGNERNETVMERLGMKVRSIPRDTFNQEFDKQPVTQEVKDVAADLRNRAQKVVEPDETDVNNAARVYVTAKRLLAAEGANALSMDCLGMVSAKLVPTPPCGAWTLLQDLGITCGCEADLFGAVSMMATSYLLDRPGYMNDPVPETYKNLLIAAHCTSGTRLAGFDQPAAPYILRDHSESSLGVSTQVLWPEGEPVTLVRFTGPGDLLIDTGKVVSNVNTPPAGGCRTSVEIAMDDVEDCRDVRGFHQVVTLGNHHRVLEGFCDLYNIKLVRSPRYSTYLEGGV